MDKIKRARLLEQQFPDGTLRWMEMRAGWDKRDPEPRKNFGIHGAELIFGVSRGNLAVVLVWMTPFYLRETRKHLQYHRLRDYDGLGSIDYHSKVQLYEGQSKITNCEYTGGDCYCDGSAIAAGELFDRTVEDPEEIWKTLVSWLEEKEKQIRDEQRDARNYS